MTDREETQERMMYCLKLRRLGHTYEEIADTVGLECGNDAFKLVERARKQIIKDDASALVQQQLDMIEYAIAYAVMPSITEGDYKAVPHLVSLLKRQADLLGLDKPKEQVIHNVAPLIREYPKEILDNV